MGCSWNVTTRVAQSAQGMAQFYGKMMEGTAQPPSLTVLGFPEHQPQLKTKQPYWDPGARGYLVKASGFAGDLFVALETALADLLPGEGAALSPFRAQIHPWSLAAKGLRSLSQRGKTEH